MSVTYNGTSGTCITLPLPECTTTTSTTTSLPAVACGVASNYSGGAGYPTTQAVTLGTGTGTISFSFDAYGVPDRFVVEWNSGVVIDTGYRGTSNYDFGGANRGTFNASLTGLTDPITSTTYPDLVNFPDDGYPRVTSPGNGSTTFNKSLASPTNAVIDVYGPLSGTAWTFTMGCPPTTTTTSTSTTTTTSTSTTTTTTTIPPTTTTTTTAAFDTIAGSFTVSNSGSSINSAVVNLGGYGPGATVSIGGVETLSPSGSIVTPSSAVFTIYSTGGGTDIVTVLSNTLACTNATVNVAGSGTTNVTITVTPTNYNGSTDSMSGDITVGIS